MSSKVVNLVVKRLLKNADYDPDIYAAHILRDGLATAAAQAGLSERDIMAQVGL